ncbi:MAG: hypothetical protein EOP45_20395 [Sphingobacteriaceae bacterium]|nr:MAG: hypothetical protein EOP45_20395 [Sphingobacteriaceae bacterium]
MSIYLYNWIVPGYITITCLSSKKHIDCDLKLPKPWVWENLSRTCSASLDLFEETIYNVFQRLVQVSGTNFSGVSRNGETPFYKVEIEVGDKNTEWEEGSIYDHIILYGQDVRNIGKHSKWNRLVVAKENWCYDSRFQINQLNNDDIAKLYNNGWRMVNGNVMYQGTRTEALTSFSSIFPPTFIASSNERDDYDDVLDRTFAFCGVYQLLQMFIVQYSNT